MIHYNEEEIVNKIEALIHEFSKLPGRFYLDSLIEMEERARTAIEIYKEEIRDEDSYFGNK